MMWTEAILFIVSLVVFGLIALAVKGRPAKPSLPPNPFTHEWMNNYADLMERQVDLQIEISKQNFRNIIYQQYGIDVQDRLKNI